MKLTGGALVSSEGSTGRESLPSSLMLLLARDISSLPHGPLHRATYSMEAGFLQSKQTRKQEGMSKTEAILFCNLISKMTSHHF